MISGMPPTRVPTNGRAHPSASNITVGFPSFRLDITKRSAAFIQTGTSASSTNPRSRTRSERPSSSIRLCELPAERAAAADAAEDVVASVGHAAHGLDEVREPLLLDQVPEGEEDLRVKRKAEPPPAVVAVHGPELGRVAVRNREHVRVVALEERDVAPVHADDRVLRPPGRDDERVRRRRLLGQPARVLVDREHARDAVRLLEAAGDMARRPGEVGVDEVEPDPPGADQPLDGAGAEVEVGLCPLEQGEAEAARDEEGAGEVDLDVAVAVVAAEPVARDAPAAERDGRDHDHAVEGLPDRLELVLDEDSADVPVRLVGKVRRDHEQRPVAERPRFRASVPSMPVSSAREHQQREPAEEPDGEVGGDRVGQPPGHVCERVLPAVRVRQGVPGGVAGVEHLVPAVRRGGRGRDPS